MDRLERALAYRVHRLARILSVSLTRILSEMEPKISSEQYFVLFRIAASEGCQQSNLVDPYLNDAPNITRLVDALAGKGLVERRRDPSDRRRHALHLTEDGRRLWRVLAGRAEQERRALYAGIGESDAEEFLRIIEVLEKNATKQTREERPS